MEKGGSFLANEKFHNLEAIYTLTARMRKDGLFQTYEKRVDI